MPERRWTILIVPEGSESPRTLNISERVFRRGRAAAVVSLVLVLGGAMALGHALPRLGVTALGAAEYGRAGQLSEGEAAELRATMNALRDTLVALGKRDQQLRLAAGLPSGDSATWGEPGALASSPDAADPRADVDSLIHKANALSRGFDEVTTAIKRSADKYAATPSIMPTAGWLTSQFTRSRSHPILHVSRPHEGIDLAAPMGAPVVAPAAGRVMRVTTQSGYGLMLELDHGNGTVTKYAHLSRVAVRQGARVTRGQAIAAVGNSGLSTGPHLHYEIHINGRVVDPLTYVLPGAIPD